MKKNNFIAIVFIIISTCLMAKVNEKDLRMYKKNIEKTKVYKYKIDDDFYLNRNNMKKRDSKTHNKLLNDYLKADLSYSVDTELLLTKFSNIRQEYSRNKEIDLNEYEKLFLRLLNEIYSNNYIKPTFTKNKNDIKLDLEIIFHDTSFFADEGGAMGDIIRGVMLTSEGKSVKFPVKNLKIKTILAIDIVDETTIKFYKYSANISLDSMTLKELKNIYLNENIEFSVYGSYNDKFINITDHRIEFLERGLERSEITIKKFDSNKRMAFTTMLNSYFDEIN